LRLNQEAAKLKALVAEKEKQLDVCKQVLSRYKNVLSDKDAEVHYSSKFHQVVAFTRFFGFLRLFDY
jgi:hypothetical protein